MQFKKFAQVLAKIEKVSGRLEMTAILAEELFPELRVEECRASFNLLQGQLLPAYQNVEFQLSEKMIVRCLARLVDSHDLMIGDNGGMAGGVDMFGEEDLSLVEKRVREKVRKSGDLGRATEEILAEKNQREEKGRDQVEEGLSLEEVYDKLVVIARENGIGSQERKLVLLAELLWEVEAQAAGYIVRMILGKMRLGFSLKTILDAMSWYVVGDKSESELLELAFQKKADLALLAEDYLFRGCDGEIMSRARKSSDENETEKRCQRLKDYRAEVGVPIVPALCQRLNTAADIIDKMGTVSAEPKYDGMRVQIHLSKDGVAAFTRGLEDVSQMFPELEVLREKVLGNGVRNCVLDSEAVGFDGATGRMLAFQDTITRRRKHNIAEKAESVPMRFFVFDLLVLNNEDLLDVELVERQQKLDELFENSLVAEHTPRLVTSNATELHDYHQAQLAEGLEGVVVKQIDSVYQSGRKGWSWVKIKEAEGTRGKLADTLDLVVMGYYYGKGKRADFGVGAFLAGVRDEASGKILSLSKIGTGLTDEQFRELKERSDKLEVGEKPDEYEVRKEMKPDVWLAPEMIVEIAADEITNSGLHTSGLSLRFPRLVRWRDDKKVEGGVTTVEEMKGF